MKKIALLQSNYIPWKGYFDLIRDVDEFYLYDEVQYTKNDWRNRNQVLTPQGKLWLTIPVRHEYLGQPINEVKIVNKNWGKKHWNTLKMNYSKSPGFINYGTSLEEFYLTNDLVFLTDVNERLIRIVCDFLGLKTPIIRSSDYDLKGNKNERIIELCKSVKAEVYVSGPAAKDYADEDLFIENDIQLKWYDYMIPDPYQQPNSKIFDPHVSVLDYLFCA